MQATGISKILIVGCGILAGLVAGSPEGGAAPAGEKLRQAVTLTKQGKYAEAVALYEALLKDKPGDQDTLGRLGPLLFLTGEHGRARQIFEQVTEKQPSWAKGWYFRAYALRKLGEHEGALRAYLAYRRLQPKDPLALYGMAGCYQALGKDAEALRAYREFAAGALLASNRASLEGWIQRARTEAEVLEKKVALARTEAAVRELLEAARKADRDGQAQEAEKLLKDGFSRLGQPPLVGNALAGILIRKRRFAEALPVLREVLKKQPTLFESRYRLALALRYTGDLTGAAEAYQAALKQDPEHPDSHFGLAETLRLAGKLKEALGLYSRYVIIEKRPAEQFWVTKARRQIDEIQKKLAGATAVVPRPGPPSAAGGDPSLDGITDPRIRALLEAKRRFQARQGGANVEGSGPSASPPPDRKPLVTGDGPKLSRDRDGDARRRREEAARRREEAKAKALEAKRAREEAARQRREEAARRREEAKAKVLEAKRAKEEAARRRQEELARKSEEAKARQARARAEKDATALLAGRRGVAMTPPAAELLTEWAGQATSKGDHARALAIWKVLSASRPGEVATLTKLAEAATAAGDHRTAAETYGALLMANPKDVSLYAKVRAAEAKAGLPLTPLPAALALPPEILQGRRLLEQGKWAEALALAQQRLKAAAGDGLAAVLESEALFAGRRYVEAKAAAERVLGTHPALAGPHRVLGGEHLRLRDRSAALAEYRLFLKKLAGDPSEESHRAAVTTLVGRLSR